MTTRVGRMIVSQTGRPVMTTGSAYAAQAAVGAPFALPYAAGVDGGTINALNLLDLGTSNAALFVHFFSTAPSSAAADGAAWTLHLVDLPYYCGAIAVNVSDWVSAGTARNIARINNQQIGVQGLSGSRTVWVQLQAPAIFTANSTANPLLMNVVGDQD